MLRYFINHMFVVHRVLITAVNATDTDLDLIFFNNCFNDKYSKGDVSLMLKHLYHGKP